LCYESTVQCSKGLFIYSKLAPGVLRLGVMGRDGAMGLRALYSACQLMHFLQQLLRAGHRGDGPPGTLQCRGAVRFGAGFLMCWFCWCDGCLCYESTVQCSKGLFIYSKLAPGVLQGGGRPGWWASGEIGLSGTLQCRGAVRFGAGFLMCLVLMVLLGVCVTKALYSARRGSLYIANWPRGCYGGIE